MATPNGAGPPLPPYDSVAEARSIYQNLLLSPSFDLSISITSLASQVHIHGPPPGTLPAIPTPWREAEAITAVKALEATVVLALLPILLPDHTKDVQNTNIDLRATVDLDHATLSLFKSYLSTVNGHGKWDKASLPYLKPTDIHRAQSNLYRPLSANMYETSTPGVFYHTHGSLEATPILNELGLPGFLDENDPRQDDYDALCELIGEQVKKYSAEELEEMTVRTRQAGGRCMTESEFLATEHGQAVSKEPMIKIEKIEIPHHPETPEVNPTPSAARSSSPPRTSTPRLLQGIKVLDLTRVIAGPSITRTLAEYGPTVLKVTSPDLPDVPWYQVDLNFGKRTCSLDLHCARDRSTFEALLSTVSVVVDGYRPGSLARLGYSPERIATTYRNRNHHLPPIYVTESCFGGSPNSPWYTRSGWQPIADAVSGLAWTHGQSLEVTVNPQPILPPFPMSDCGTGALGSVGALIGLFHCLTQPSSSSSSSSFFVGHYYYHISTSLVSWNLFVQRPRPYPEHVWREMLSCHAPEIREFGLTHWSNFDVVSQAAINGMRRVSPRLFVDDDNDHHHRHHHQTQKKEYQYMFTMTCPGFKGAVVKSLRPVVQYDPRPLQTGFQEGMESRPNGYDEPGWW